MKNAFTRDDEFYSRYERFKTRVRELRGLRVNQFLNLLDHNQLKRVKLVEKEIEEFVRKFAYSSSINPIMQESILILYNSDIVMRRRIEQRASSPDSKGPFIVPVVKNPSRNTGGDPGPGDVDAAAGGDENGTIFIDGRVTSYFVPTDREIARQASLLMGGKPISPGSLATLRSAIRKKLASIGDDVDSGVRPPEKVVKLAFTASGKVKIQVGVQKRKRGSSGQDTAE